MRDLTIKNEAVNIFGFRRPRHLETVLERVLPQIASNSHNHVHIWIDGISHSKELKEKNEACRELAKSYPSFKWRLHNGRYGIEKLMLDVLDFSKSRYSSMLILEDDCIPSMDCIDHIFDTLSSSTQDTATVYGHHFKVPSEEPGKPFPRFQGWGWAAKSHSIREVLPSMTRMFLLNEEDYRNTCLSLMAQDGLSDRINVTPGRNVSDVLQRHFSWDSCFTLLTAAQNKYHMPTPRMCIVNAGISTESGNFKSNDERFRTPPFNMLKLDEVTAYFQNEGRE